MMREELGMASNRKVKEKRDGWYHWFLPQAGVKQGEESPSSEGNRFVFSVRSSLRKDQLVWDRLWHQAVLPQDFRPSYGLEVH